MARKKSVAAPDTTRSSPAPGSSKRKAVRTPGEKRAAPDNTRVSATAAPLAAAPPATQAAKNKPQTAFPIVGVGASAGGLEAMETFFKAMPDNPGIGFVLVVHLDPSHVSILPELLQKHTGMPVRTIADGELL